MASLLDFFSMSAPNVMPTSGDGSPDQLGFFGSNRNALVGLGLGLMGGTRDDPMGNALRGYTAGANADQQSIYRQYLMRKAAQDRADTLAQREEAKRRDQRDFDESRRRWDAAQTPDNFERGPDGVFRPKAGGPADPAYLKQVAGAREGIPTGFRQSASGGLEPIPGGPTDPTYLKAANEAKEKPRQFSVSDVTKLSEEGGKFADVTRFGDRFEERFAGYKLPGVGSMAMQVGRVLPEGVVGKDVADAAAFWQDYDKYRSVVRNELYGSALTPGERKDFEAADVSPGMDPKQITKNLARQKEIVGNGMKRKANGLIEAGYPAEVISKTYGLDLKELGVTGKGAAAPPPGAAPPVATPSTTPSAAATPPPGVQYDNQDIVDARKAIATGKITKQQAMTRLLKAGIKVRPEDLD